MTTLRHPELHQTLLSALVIISDVLKDNLLILFQRHSFKIHQTGQKLHCGNMMSACPLVGLCVQCLQIGVGLLNTKLVTY